MSKTERFMHFSSVILLTTIFGLVFQAKWINCQRLLRSYGLPKPMVFDSYHKMTPFEDLPEVCTAYSDERCATLWLQEMTKVVIRNDNRLANVAFQYSADINEANLKLLNAYHMEAFKFDKSFQDKTERFKSETFQNPEIRRIFRLFTSTIVSKNESVRRDIVEMGNRITFIYNSARPCFKACLKPGEAPIVDLFKHERDYDNLAGFWTAWGNVTGVKIKDMFIKRMNLENIGAKENGYTNAASYNLMNDFGENDFIETVLKLFNHISPLYQELHAYVRHCLARYYPGRFDKDGAIPAHLFGNVWAQKWENIFPIIKQCSGERKTYNYQKKTDDHLAKIAVNKMFKIAEEFYESIGMYKMTDEFWERSVLVQPEGKVADCHSTSYDFANGADYRILMCSKQNLNHFQTIHHEMGHIQYFMAYRNLPVLYRESANPGIEEAIGDTIALAVKTPEHLQKIGLISRIPASNDIDYLMATALEKIAFLPFALTMDIFLWGVYNGSVPISQLNKHWWDLRYKYQGLKPPVERSENDFDPGAKLHMAFGVPYIRYYISIFLQFQFYEAMCNISGHKGPLHRCDFHGSKRAGSKLLEMLKKGKSQDWRKTLNILTGDNDIQHESLLTFFEPLYKWLKNRNRELNISVGW